MQKIIDSPSLNTRAVTRCVSFHEITIIVPTLTSNIIGTAPGEHKGQAEQQEPGQAEQAELFKPNQEIAGGTLDPAPPKNKLTGRAEQLPQNIPKPLTTDQAEQMEEEPPNPNPHLDGGHMPQQTHPSLALK